MHCILINSSTIEIWNENSNFMNSSQIIDYNLIDQISGVNEGNKYREVTKVTNHVFCGTSLKAEDFVIKWKTNGQTRHKIYIEICFKHNTLIFNFYFNILTKYFNFYSNILTTPGISNCSRQHVCTETKTTPGAYLFVEHFQTNNLTTPEAYFFLKKHFLLGRHGETDFAEWWGKRTMDKRSKGNHN